MFAMHEIVAGVAFMFLFLASYFDLRTGEIPEKITRSFIVIILFISSILTYQTLDYSFLFESVAVGVVFFALGYVMFYLGEWGGGDVKLLAGVGCSLGLLNAMGYFTQLQGALPYYINYFINFAIAASPYAILYSLLLGLMKPAVFEEFVKNLTDKKYIILIFLSFSPSIFTMALNMHRLSLIYLLVPILALISLYLKAVEEIALQKSISISELKEWDILAHDLVVDGRRIARKRDIEGISKEQLEEIHNLASQGRVPADISIRWGIRFAPVFFIAFLMTFIFGNVLELIVLSFLS